MAEDRTPSTSPEPDNVAPNETNETDESYTCSECGQKNKFEYRDNEDDACCPECKHPKCEDCKAD
ncbi:hypothetical protein F5Y03DRAFT_246365 [Xylaria venustula]|nr:hypothetical protein F5Y03DRAFT_246365 [Xylaria venustula]